MEFKGL